MLKTIRLWLAIDNLSSANTYKRRKGVKILGMLGDVRAIGALIGVLQDRDEQARFMAAEVLSTLGWQPQDDHQHITLALAARNWEKAASYGAIAVDPLLEAMRNHHEYSSIASARDMTSAMEKIRDRNAVGPLVRALEEEREWIREAAAKTLGHIGDTRAVKPLIRALQDAHKWTRQNGRYDFQQQRGYSVRTNTGDCVRHAAIYALGEIGGARAIEALVDVLRDQQRDAQARQIAVEALDKIGGEKVMASFIAAFGDYNEKVASSAVNAVVKLGNAGVEVLIALLNDHTTPQKITIGAMKALGSLGDVRAVEPLLALLTTENSPAFKLEVVQALEQIGNASAVDPLVSILANWATTVQEAMEAAKIGSSSRAFTNIDRNQPLHSAILKALGRIGGEQALHISLALLDDQNCPVNKLSIVQALIQLKDARALSSLLALYAHEEDKHKEILSAIVAALGRTLEHDASHVSKQNLEQIVALNNTTVHITSYRDGCWGGTTEIHPMTIDCTQVRQLARQELIRRGLEIS